MFWSISRSTSRFFLLRSLSSQVRIGCLCKHSSQQLQPSDPGVCLFPVRSAWPGESPHYPHNCPVAPSIDIGLFSPFSDMYGGVVPLLTLLTRFRVYRWLPSIYAVPPFLFRSFLLRLGWPDFAVRPEFCFEHPLPLDGRDFLWPSTPFSLPSSAVSTLLIKSLLRPCLPPLQL